MALPAPNLRPHSNVIGVMLKRLPIAAATVVLAIPLHAATKPGRFPLESAEGLELVHVVAKAVTYQGHKALRLDQEKNYAGEPVALMTGTEFTDGTIEVDLAGVPGAGSDAGARGFVGIAFRSTPHAVAFECFYLRPTNGRADD